MPDILLAKAAGYCFGVKRSIDLCERALKEKKLYLFGPPIHNPQVVKSLTQKGAILIDSLEKAPEEATVLIRAHGIAPEYYAIAEKRRLKIVDSTCPFVAMVQKKAHELEQQGFRVVIVGERNHPEVLGILGNAPSATIIENAEQAKAFAPDEQFFSTDELSKQQDSKAIEMLYAQRIPKIGIVAQTTQSDENFSSIVKELSLKARELHAFNTICNATHARQPAATELAKSSDAMVVVGGKDSGNTKRLFELCSKHCKTFWVETAAELNAKGFKGKKRIGVTAGASTPDYLIREVMDFLKSV